MAARVGGRRRFGRILTISIAIGILVGTVSFLAGSLSVPGPARAAGVAELRERGAARFYAFCSWPKFEPHFWPECVGTADDWRARGADRMVEQCSGGEPSRLFKRGDCLSEERPIAALTAPPDWADVAAAGAGAGMAFVALLLLSLARDALRPGARFRPLGP